MRVSPPRTWFLSHRSRFAAVLIAIALLPLLFPLWVCVPKFPVGCNGEGTVVPDCVAYDGGTLLCISWSKDDEDTQFIPTGALVDGQLAYVSSSGDGEMCVVTPPMTRTGEVDVLVVGKCIHVKKPKESSIGEITAKVTVSPPPTVTAIDPSSGSVCGGEDVVISGSGFDAETEVTVSGVRGGKLVYVPFYDGEPTITPTRITGKTANHEPYGSGKAVVVVAAGPDGCKSSASGSFVYEQDDCYVFEPFITLSTGVDAPAMVAVGDMNSDGHNDVVVGFSGVNIVSIHHGDGAGEFPSRATVTLDTGDTPNAVCTGDFNGDGRDDIAVACASKRMVRVLQESPGVLAVQKNTMALPGTPSAILSGKMSSDSNDDILVQLSDYPRLVFTADGLTPLQVPPTDLPYPPLATNAGTMPGSTRTGVFVTGRSKDLTAGYLNFIENNSSSDGLTWTPDPIDLPTSAGTLFIPTTLALADWTTDPQQELILASSSRDVLMLMRYSHGSGLVPLPELYTGWFPQLMMPGSFYSTAVSTQLAVTTGAGDRSELQILVSSGTAYYPLALGASAYSMATGRLDGDDWDEIIVGLDTGDVVVTLSTKF